MKKDKRKTLSTIFGDELNRLRKEKHYTQTQVAENVNVTQAAIGQYEKGKRIPSAEVVIALSEFFKVPSEDLLELRRMAVFETVMLLGDDAPLALKNERNMIAHGWDPDADKQKQNVVRDQPDMYYESNDSAKGTKAIVKIQVKTNGSLVVDGKEMSTDELNNYLKLISNNSKN